MNLSLSSTLSLGLGARVAPAAVCSRPSEPLWSVPAGEVLRLPASPRGRWVRVREGRLWLTADARGPEFPAEDWWVVPGESLHLPAGVPVLAEGWPSARFELLEEPV